ncbi:MAG: glycosyltransferase [Bacteroidia bacterium]|nr:glycosyltransferase [Bacteroidia bacterium]
MKILIGTVDVCGWINLLSEELKRQGHEVINISEPNKFNPEYKFDIDPKNYAKDFLKCLQKKKPFKAFILKTALKILGQKTDSRIKNFIYNYSRNFFSDYCDVFIYLWNGIATDESDLILFKKKGKKIITWFVGDDVRDYPTMQKHFNISNNFYDGYFKKSFKELVNKLRMHEKYADIIYSLPDQASLALRPYYHLQIPVQLSRFKFNITNNTVPVVVHIPSSPQIKGTEIIRKAIHELKNDGVEFVYKELINIPNKKVLEELSDADILVDELYLHGPGVLSFEAMASGCAVATRHIEKSPQCFSPPVIAITEINVRDKIKLLVTNNELRNDLINKGKAYVEANNSVERIVSLMMKNLLDEGTPDYYPDYLTKDYLPSSEVTDFLNAQTAFVQNEDWYKSNIKQKERAGLKF